MPENEERLDEGLAIERLNAALEMQYRSALQYSIVAASLRGLEAQALSAKLTSFGDEELSGVRQLIEKVVSFGGEPATGVGDLRAHKASPRRWHGWSNASRRRSKLCRRRSSRPGARVAPRRWSTCSST